MSLGLVGGVAPCPALLGIAAMTSTRKTGERIVPEDFESVGEYFLYLRSPFAYGFVKDKISGGRLVLKIGCGEGCGAKAISQHIQRIVGSEADTGIVIHASRKYGTRNCVFVPCDGTKLPFRRDTFDAIISFQVTEYVTDGAGFLSEI